MNNDNEVVIHPVGIMEIRQNVLPLQHELELLGRAPIKNYEKMFIERLIKSCQIIIDEAETLTNGCKKLVNNLNLKSNNK